MYLALNGTLVSPSVKGAAFPGIAASAGFTATEVYATGPEMAAALSESGVRPAAMPFPVEFRKDDATFRAGLATLPGAARFAACIGCFRMGKAILPSADTPKHEWRTTIQGRLRECGPILEEHGMRVGLEFVTPLHLRQERPHEFIWRMDEMLGFARECGPSYGLLIDSWHWHHAGHSGDMLAALDARDIVHVHIADAPDVAPAAVRDQERLLPGEGVVDWPAFFGGLRAAGYNGPVSPEIFGRGLDRLPVPNGARFARQASLAAAGGALL